MECSSLIPESMKVIDPIFDVGFKLIFGRERVSESLLIDLLNSIFEGDPKFGNIIKLQFINTEYPNELVNGKGLRYDVQCVTSNGHRFIVEMQKAEQKHFLERCHYYVDRAIASQGYRGMNEENINWDFSLEPVVGVFFCAFHVHELECKAVTKARLCDQENGKPIGDYERYVFIQLPFFRKSEDECESETDKWIYNIKNMGPMQRVAFTNYNDTFKYLESVSNVATLSQSDREIYEAELMKARDYNAVMNTAIEKAEARGIEKGEEIGKLSMAKMLFKQGIPLNVIAESAGLSMKKIKDFLGL